MELTQYYMMQNPCYTQAKPMKPQGIVVHDTNAGNPNICRYVGPDDGIIGKNRYGNYWNKPTATKCVHAFIGLDQFGTVRTYNVLPWTYKCWGCGGGAKGSYNNTHIQFEICDDGYKDGNGTEEYFERVWTEAVELCAYLCKMYSLPIQTIVSHKEAHKAGFASNHSDTSVWFAKHGRDMDVFRAEVEKKLRNTVITNRDTYLLYGAGSRARKLIWLPKGTEIKLANKKKNGYQRATVTATYTGYIPESDFGGLE